MDAKLQKIIGRTREKVDFVLLVGQNKPTTDFHLVGIIADWQCAHA